MAVATDREYGLFINGELVEPASGELRHLTEPATGNALGRVAMAGEADIDRAVEAARAALDGPWGKTPPTERSRLLHALAEYAHALHAPYSGPLELPSMHALDESHQPQPLVDAQSAHVLTELQPCPVGQPGLLVAVQVFESVIQFEQ